MTNPAPTPRPKIKVPRKYGNKYFNLMEAPIECWPATTIVKLLGGGRPPEGQLVEIPTAEVFAPGDFVSRRYATTPFWKIERWLYAHDHFGFTSYCVENSPALDFVVEGDEPEIAPPFDGHGDAGPGL
jgi:hypothetical protein